MSGLTDADYVAYIAAAYGLGLATVMALGAAAWLRLRHWSNKARDHGVDTENTNG